MSNRRLKAVGQAVWPAQGRRNRLPHEIVAHLAAVALLAAWCAGSAWAQPPTPGVGDIVNLASYNMRISPGSMVRILGWSLSGSVAECATPQGLPRGWCADVQVELSDGATTYLAAMRRVTLSPNTIELQIPVELAPGAYALRVVRRAGAQQSPSAWLGISLAPFAPGLYYRDESGTALGRFLNQSNQEITGNSPANPGENVSVFATGLGRTNPQVATGQMPAGNTAPTTTAIPSVRVAGRPAALRYSVLVPGQVGLYQVGFTVPPETPSGEQPVQLEISGWTSNTVHLPVAGAPRPRIDWVINGASFGPGMVSGSWMALKGANLASTTRLWALEDFEGDRLPLSLDGVSVTVNGKPAAVSYISPEQVNFQVPSDSTTGVVTVEVRNSLGSATREATLQPLSPGLFVFLGWGHGNYVAAAHLDGVFVGPRDLFQGAVPSRPAREGDIVQLFGTWFGATDPPVPTGEIVRGAAPLADSNLSIRIGGVPARVMFAGLAGAGLYQFNVVVPRVPAGDQSVVAEIGELVSQPGKFIAIE